MGIFESAFKMTLWIDYQKKDLRTLKCIFFLQLLHRLMSAELQSQPKEGLQAMTAREIIEERLADIHAQQK
jgi:hypothetical protein